MKTKLITIALLTLFAVASGHRRCEAQSNASAPTKANDAGAAGDSPAHNYFTDVMLVNQDGKPMRFYSDLLKGKVVIINTFFTTCTSICPPMSRSLEKIQEWLGDRLGKDVYIISMSVDPVTDTPTRLKQYGRGYNARPGWYFITGKKENVEFALYKIGQKVEKPDDHSSVMIIGNETTGLWKKAFGLAAAPKLIEVLESVLNDKGGEK